MENFKLHFGGWPSPVLLRDQRNASIKSILRSLTKAMFWRDWVVKVLVDYFLNLDVCRDLPFYLKTLKLLL
jgi:hypothetical protein